MSARPEIRLHPILDGVEPKLLEAGDFGLGKVLVCEVLESRAFPKLEPFAELLGRSIGIILEKMSPGLDDLLESPRVDVLRVDHEGVAVILGDENVAALACLPLRFEDRSQTGDIDPEGALFAVRPLAPKVFEDPLRRHHPIGVEQQKAQQPSLLLWTDVDRPTLVEHFKWTEDAVIQAVPPSETLRGPGRLMRVNLKHLVSDLMDRRCGRERVLQASTEGCAAGIDMTLS
ncbi:MAG: hypothetical protein U9N56_09445 [Actinomycetota bacterium]|nr:hypothetical protein [Actinomycetota bacterium]